MEDFANVYGKENGYTEKELEDIWGLSNRREAHLMIRKARMQGIPIICDYDSGIYYIPNTDRNDETSALERYTKWLIFKA